jgi:hypothetical protein
MIPLILLVGQVAAASPGSACLGLEAVKPGTTWTCSGWRQWSADGGGEPDSAAVQWTTTVLAVRVVPAGQLLLVRGFVSELAWSVPTAKPRLSILACLGDRLLRMAFVADSAARYRFEHWTDASAGHGEVLLQQPLKDGASCGQGPEAYRLTMRTLPDHQIVEWRESVGITAYTCVHHGTPAAAEVRLARCRGG